MNWIPWTLLCIGMTLLVFLAAWSLCKISARADEVIEQARMERGGE